MKDRTKVIAFIIITIMLLLLIEVSLAIYSAAIQSDIVYSLDASFLEAMATILSALGIGSWVITVVKTCKGSTNSDDAEYIEPTGTSEEETNIPSFLNKKQ